VKVFTKEEEEMNSRKGIMVAVFSIVLAVAFVGSLALADEFDEAMKLTFSQPIAIPKQVLPAGTYWFVRAGHGSEPNVIQVFDQDRKKVLATLETGTEQIVKPSGRVTISLADRSPQPQALLTLVYPGRTDGHQFEITYSAEDRKQISEYPKISMRVNDKGEIERIDPNTGNRMDTEKKKGY
jgi:hypothetical protein